MLMAIQGPRAVFAFIRRSGRRIGVTVLGILLVIAGIILMLPLVPGPGFLVLLAGLSVLATEYTWAEVMLDKVKERARRVRHKLLEDKKKPGPEPEEAETP
jgi:uncharacterized protein (TIGR02611 family)